ncbi:MAG: cell division protein ZipA C-terminal FtsZ-binding domain-containing protein [Rhodocyclaceae bacterium]|nr:cell division protein ZipA C-terminal FtsZ-binding domain-containing protein [Rhodocyclaceae bacterium]
MSELQLALIGLGLGLVAGVWGYNLWLERRHRRRAEKMLPEAVPDVLMQDRDAASPPPAAQPASDPALRREPVIGRDVEASIPSKPAAEAVPPAPTVGASLSAEASPGPAAARPLAPVPEEWADGRADCLLRVEFAEPVSVAALWADYSSWAGRLDKPVQWLGLDSEAGRWRNLSPQDPGAVLEVAAALQLADRRGPVSAATLEAFLAGMKRLAQSFAGLVELPDPAPILSSANALDAFCASVDLQFSLQVVPRPGSLSGMPGGKLKALIDSAGLVREGERFVATDADGAVLFTLGCAAATAHTLGRLDGATLTGLTFSLDVPRVRDGAAAFDRLLAFARQCAAAVGGVLVDTHRKPLAEETIMAIRRRIGELQAQMAAQGIPAGSVRALRLFA